MASKPNFQFVSGQHTGVVVTPVRLREAMRDSEHVGRVPRLRSDCWQCGKRMSDVMRAMRPFCSDDCEHEYNRTE